MPVTARNSRPTDAAGDGTLISRAANRSLALRQATSTEEVQRIVDAAYRVIERSGRLDPTMREILQEAGLSTQAFYRHFRSKDELLVTLLDDGRRRLVGYLRHQMAKAQGPAGQVRAWVEGVLAQATDPEAAARTRPFLANLDRLAEQYPDEQRASVELMIEPLAEAVTDLGDGTGPAWPDAVAIYHLAVGAMHSHIRDGTAPSAGEVEHLVGFVLAALGDR
jgi:AcrR family transcriptional regulator